MLILDTCNAFRIPSGKGTFDGGLIMSGESFSRSILRRALCVLAGALVLGPIAAPAADHLDGPRLMANPTALGNLDINDVYIFRAFNPRNTVLIMTLSPAAGVLGPASFNPIATYQFEIENNPNDTSPDLSIRFTFGGPNRSGQQPFQYSAFDPSGRVLLSGKGVSGKNNLVSIGGMVRPDLYDDPFFFDLNAFNLFKSRALAGDPTAGSVFLNRNVKNIPQNFFGGFNVMAIVLEVPSVLLQSSRGNTKIGVWARTFLPGDLQFDRMARPAINTVLIPDDHKDLFNSSVPAQDTTFIPIATVELTKLFGDATSAQAHATLLLPDIMTFDTSSSQGFLNGRRLIDDVIDAELTLLSNGVVTSDGVVNDSVFSARFPYLGKPNPKKVTLQALQVAVQGQGAPIGLPQPTPTTTSPRGGAKAKLSETNSRASGSNGGGMPAGAQGQNTVKAAAATGGMSNLSGGMVRDDRGMQIGVPNPNSGNTGVSSNATSNPVNGADTQIVVPNSKTAKAKAKTAKAKAKAAEAKSKTDEAKSK
jgi:hypothetical protein